MTSRFLIYGLVDPRTGQVRYIGKSCKGMERPKEHGRPWHINHDRGYKGSWLRLLKRLGLTYSILVLEEVPEGDSPYLGSVECEWIAYGRHVGWPLTNLTDGGDGQSPGYVTRPETRALQRAVKLGRKKSAETRARMRAAQSVNCKAVIDMTSGVRYPSLTAAAAALGLKMKAISQVLRGEKPRTRGHHFIYADGV